MEYGTLAGQLVASIGILAGKNKKDMKRVYRKLQKQFNDKSETSIEEMSDRILKLFEIDREDIPSEMIYLIYDSRGIYAPQITLIGVADDILVGLPLDPTRTVNGIVLKFNEGEEYAKVERVFEESK